MIKVRTLGVQTRKEVPAQEGMTVEQTLQAAGVEHYNPPDYMITVNGEETGLDAQVPDGALVVVTQKVTNG